MPCYILHIHTTHTHIPVTYSLTLPHVSHIHTYHTHTMYILHAHHTSHIHQKTCNTQHHTTHLSICTPHTPKITHIPHPHPSHRHTTYIPHIPHTRNITHSHIYILPPHTCTHLTHRLSTCHTPTTSPSLHPTYNTIQHTYIIHTLHIFTPYHSPA